VNAPPELVAQVRRDLATLVRHAATVREGLETLAKGADADAARGLVERHIEVRSLGELASRGAEEADELLRMAVDDEEARASVRGLMAFADGDKVFRALARVLPRSFRALSPEGERAIRERARSLMDQRLWADLPVTLGQVFVPPAARVVDQDGRTGERTRAPTEQGAIVGDAMEAAREAIKTVDLTVIAGVPGSGKSAIAAALAASLADASDLLPVWLDRASLARFTDPASTLDGVLTSALGVGSQQLQRHGHVVAIIDGIDDLPIRSATLRTLLSGLRDGTFARIVVTARRRYLSSLWRATPGNHRVIELEPLDRDQVERWCAMWREALDLTPGYARGFDASHYLDAPGDAPDELGDALSGLVRLPFGLSLLANLHAHGRRLPKPSSTRRRAEVIREVLDGACAEVAREVRVPIATARDALRRLAVLKRAAIVDEGQRALWEKQLGLDASSAVLRAFGRSFLLGGSPGGDFVHQAFSDELTAEYLASRVATILQRADHSPTEFVLETREATSVWVAAVSLIDIDASLLALLAEMLPDWSAFANGRRRRDRSAELLDRLLAIFARLVKDQALEATVAAAQATGLNHSLVVAKSLAACFALSALTAPDRKGRLPLGRTSLAPWYPQAWGRIRTELGRDFLFDVVQLRTALTGCPDDLLDTIAYDTDLSGLDVSDTSLRGIYLIGETLYGTSFCGADLRDSRLESARLFVSDFSGADLRGADVDRAIFEACVMDRTILIGVDLSRADFHNTDLSRAILTEADALALGVTLRP